MQHLTRVLRRICTQLAPMTPEAAIAGLTALVVPPERPTRPPQISWAEFERRNGFAAPTDYRLVLERYGVGGFGATELAGGWLYLFDPFDPEQSLVEQSEWERRNIRGLQRQFPEQYPGWTAWPEADGLLPWATSIDGDLIGWWTAGTPDSWGTRFFARHDEFEEFAFGMAEFTLRLLGGDLGAPGLDQRFESLDFGETLQFFPLSPEALRPPERPREDVTVRFAGLASTIDPASIPSSARVFQAKSPEEVQARSDEYRRRFAAATRPADDIVESWKPAAEQIGLQIRAFGASSAGGDDPLHHELSCSFELDVAPAAKRLVLELSNRLGVAIAEVRNLDHDRIWEDITSPQ
jgi:hypothetical protein